MKPLLNAAQLAHRKSSRLLQFEPIANIPHSGWFQLNKKSRMCSDADEQGSDAIMLARLVPVSTVSHAEKV